MEETWDIFSIRQIKNDEKHRRENLYQRKKKLGRKTKNLRRKLEEIVVENFPIDHGSIKIIRFMDAIKLRERIVFARPKRVESKDVHRIFKSPPCNDLCSDSTCKCTPLRVCGLSIGWHGYTIIR